MARKPKHGMSKTRIYQIWADMKTRCNNKNNPFYHRYGGRGITYCDEWEEFSPFFEWAMQNGYRSDLTIERIDNDGNYNPENCKWATQHEQHQNKSHAPNKTGFKGVRAVYRNGKVEGYRSVVWHDGREIYVGFAKTPEEVYAKREKYILENLLKC